MKILIYIFFVYISLNLCFSQEPKIIWQKSIIKEHDSSQFLSINFFKFVDDSYYLGYNQICKDSAFKNKIYSGLMKFDTEFTLKKSFKLIDKSKQVSNIYLLKLLKESDKLFKLETYIGGPIPKPMNYFFNSNLEIQYISKDTNSPNGYYSFPLNFINSKYYTSSNLKNPDTDKKELFISEFDQNLSYIKSTLIKIPVIIKDSINLILPEILFINNDEILSYLKDKEEGLYNVLIDTNGNIKNFKKLNLSIKDTLKKIKLKSTGLTKVVNNDSYYHIVSTFSDPFLGYDRYLVKMDKYGNILWSKNIADDIEIQFGKYYINLLGMKLINNEEFICLFGNKKIINPKENTRYLMWLQIYDTLGNFIEKYTWNPNKLDADTNEIEISEILEKENSNLLLTERMSNGDSILFQEIELRYNSVLDNFKNKSLTFHINPNPASTSINISIINNELFDYEIYDILGILRSKKKDNESRNIDISNLTAGLYLIKIRQGNQIYFQKFIRE